MSISPNPDLAPEGRLPHADGPGLVAVHCQVRHACKELQPLLNYVVLDRGLHLVVDLHNAWDSLSMSKPAGSGGRYAAWHTNGVQEPWVLHLMILVPHVLYTVLVGSALLRTAQFNYLAYSTLTARVMDAQIKVGHIPSWLP